MKNLLLIIISLLLFSCQSRKRDIVKENQESELQNSTNFSTEASADYRAKKENEIFNFLQNKAFKITSSGSDYEFTYGDLKFKGNASVEFSDQKKETKIVQKFETHLTYKTQTIYKTKTTYKTETTYKSVKTDKKGTTIYIWIAIGFLMGVLVLFFLQKLIKSQWYLQVFSKILK